MATEHRCEKLGRSPRRGRDGFTTASENDVTARIGVVVPTFRRPDGLRRLVHALNDQSLDPTEWELVVVDDGSGAGWADEVDRAVAACVAPARVVHLAANCGPARARNEGWRRCSAPIVAFTDDDCFPAPGWLASGLEAILAAPRTGIVQGPTRRPPSDEHRPANHLTVAREVTAPSPWFEGCNLFVRREALDATGGFDEELGMHGEDTVLGWAVLGAGWERAWAASALVYHEVVERPWKWHLKIHFLERNLVPIARRYPPIVESFWRPWAVKRENALFALAALGLLGAAMAPGRGRRLAGLLVVPYGLWLVPPWRRPVRPASALHQVAVHAASLAGKATAWVPGRRFLL